MDERAFDVVVIGAGAPGEVIAGRLGEAGLEVAIVEERLVGGECSFYACMPSKALLRPGRARGGGGPRAGRRDRRGSTWRQCSRGATRSSTTSTTRRQLPWLEERGVTLVRGHGRLDGERRVRVGDEALVARKAVVVATGQLRDDPAGAGSRRGRVRGRTSRRRRRSRSRAGSSSSAAASSGSRWRRPGRRSARR